VRAQERGRERLGMRDFILLVYSDTRTFLGLRLLNGVWSETFFLGNTDTARTADAQYRIIQHLCAYTFSFLQVNMPLQVRLSETFFLAGPRTPTLQNRCLPAAGWHSRFLCLAEHSRVTPDAAYCVTQTPSKEVSWTRI